MTYLLDTAIFTLAYFRSRGLPDRLAAEQAAHVVAISVVTRVEVLSGRFASVVKAADGPELLRAVDSLDRSERFLVGFTVLPFGPAAAAQFDRLRADKKRKKIGREDLLIACVAIAHGATLVTRNMKDFAHVPGLRTENGAD